MKARQRLEKCQQRHRELIAGIQVEEENDIMLEPAAGVSVTINNSTRVGPKKVNRTKHCI